MDTQQNGATQTISATAPPSGYYLGNNLYIVEVDIDDLKEQVINAQTMAPRDFDRLVANIRERGALESLPYCWQKNGAGAIEIVSGHHRVRAAKAAGLKRIHILLDISDFPRSKIVAKQLAHNALVGKSDAEVINQILPQIDNPEDLLATGLSKEFLADLRKEIDPMLLFTPTMDLRWKTISFPFLPHQMQRMEELLDRLDGPQDLVIAALESQWDVFLGLVTKLARIKKIRAGGTMIAYLVELAHAELDKHERESERESRDAKAGTAAATSSAA